MRHMSTHTATAGTVHWLALGGTIQAVGHDALDLDRYHLTGRSLSPEQLLAPVAELLGDIRAETWGNRPSHHLGVEDLLALASRVRAVAATGDTHGVVVTCGSNGLEELAYLLWLLHSGPVPVVVTASMRPPTAVGTDALLNLAASVTAARSAATRTASVLVASDGALLHPARAYKHHTSRVDSFASSAPALGAVGPDGSLDLWGSAGPSPVSGVDIPARLARVEIVTSYLGADGSAVRAAAGFGSEGVVAAGTGAGFVTEGEERALAEVSAAGVVVCHSRRTPDGRVLPKASDVLVSNRLTPQKARLALATGLTLGLDMAGIQELLDAPR